MNWIQRKIYLYNVTFGLYMLDWWERCTFNILVIVLMGFVLRYATQFFKRAFTALCFLISILSNCGYVGRDERNLGSPKSKVSAC